MERTTSAESRRPPHGGRGLKYVLFKRKICSNRSSSTRRTWIEIEDQSAVTADDVGRPPHGGRGLKSVTITSWNASNDVVLHTEDVD